MNGSTFDQEKPRPVARARVIAGLRCAPDIDAVALIASVTAMLQTAAICHSPTWADLKIAEHTVPHPSWTMMKVPKNSAIISRINCLLELELLLSFDAPPDNLREEDE
mmetsp:Transcript_6494/g.8079  ORF Transcript_6494/g.8079 Transcript_6494/m.8079 type:complete len:108 (+) Transcript_6494:474-797(+)